MLYFVTFSLVQLSYVKLKFFINFKSKFNLELINGDTMEIKKVDEMFDLAVTEISSFLKNKLISKDDVAKARIASSAMSMYQRFRATVNSETSMKYRICKDLAKDKEELEKYISITTPELKLKA